ncbi:MAG: hypothetical protein IE909_10670 [Campylobacterales bacterium]|nr:hypothetical protein [Campylobacterales bacterium]
MAKMGNYRHKNKLQVRLDDETQSIMEKLKSPNIKSFFVMEAIKAFSKSEESGIFFKDVAPITTPTKADISKEYRNETKRKIQEWS